MSTNQIISARILAEVANGKTIDQAYDAVIRFSAVNHICRDAGYSPRVSACRACLTQMSRNGVEANKKRKH